MDYFEMIKKMIFEALEQLYANDKYLINNDNIKFWNQGRNDLKNYISERAVVFRFGIYFNDLVKKTFLDYYLDCEYNRNIDEKNITFLEKWIYS